MQRLDVFMPDRCTVPEGYNLCASCTLFLGAQDFSNEVAHADVAFHIQGHIDVRCSAHIDESHAYRQDERWIAERKPRRVLKQFLRLPLG